MNQKSHAPQPSPHVKWSMIEGWTTSFLLLFVDVKVDFSLVKGKKEMKKIILLSGIEFFFFFDKIQSGIEYW